MRAKDARGKPEGTYDLIFATTFHAGNGADFSTAKKISNRDSGLERRTWI